MLKRFTAQHFFHCFSFVIRLVQVWTQTLKRLYFAPGRPLVFYPGGVLLILAYSGRLRREGIPRLPYMKGLLFLSKWYTKGKGLRGTLQSIMRGAGHNSISVFCHLARKIVPLGLDINLSFCQSDITISTFHDEEKVI